MRMETMLVASVALGVASGASLLTVLQHTHEAPVPHEELPAHTHDLALPHEELPTHTHTMDAYGGNRGCHVHDEGGRSVAPEPDQVVLTDYGCIVLGI